MWCISGLAGLQQNFAVRAVKFAEQHFLGKPLYDSGPFIKCVLSAGVPFCVGEHVHFFCTVNRAVELALGMESVV